MGTRSLFIIGLLCLASCGSYNSIDSFYEAHKNDNQVTAIRVPQFMLTTLSGISPEIKELIGGANDLRYMHFAVENPSRAQFLNTQINGITGNSFIEIFRKNDELKRSVVSIRERKNSVKEILIYNNNISSGSLLYINGDFNPARVRHMAQNNDFDNLGNFLGNYGVNLSN
ncbi:DUF4252 domain-containing protein [Arenibacter aquaticus]|uniref:DUF4252 domain-containing protein n=1 Tax=Arenibacter aquaticus TaxID=2489054 RepID=A0A430K009_9FLAO|nr:DUF4252 domain-containing protein [Arenibacter aquaticus]RTE52484.1 DUF4252 domain-containing protein [Arenibacter aquaticus]